MTNDQIQAKAAEIAELILERMGGDAETICTGDCTTFAKRMIDALSAEGIEAVIIDNLSDEMKDELNGYPVEQGDDNRISHCYVEVNRWSFHDAFDTEGVLNEDDLSYTYKCN